MTRTADVAVVGGGIVGASIAYHLALRGVEKVVVFEREEELGRGSTGKCAGGVRLQFSTAANVEMSRWSIAALKRFEEELGQAVDFKQNGYLFALTTAEDLETFRANAARQRDLGVPVEVLSPQEAGRIVPEMRTDDLAGATFCGEDGIANPHAIVQGYASGARRLGARFHRAAEVASMEISSRRVTALLAGGERWEVGSVVNAAGPWAKLVSAMAGLALPVEPVRRQYFLTSPLGWVPDGFPLLIDWGTGAYMHKESGGMLVGESDPGEPPGFLERVDWDFLARVGEHAVHRVPRLAEAELKTGVAGLYEVSPDHNAILGPVPELDNFFCANGFSGHGMQHAPAVGLALAELLIEGRSRSLDISAYSIERFSRAPAAEHNVI